MASDNSMYFPSSPFASSVGVTFIGCSTGFCWSGECVGSVYTALAMCRSGTSFPEQNYNEAKLPKNTRYNWKYW